MLITEVYPKNSDPASNSNCSTNLGLGPSAPFGRFVQLEYNREIRLLSSQTARQRDSQQPSSFSSNIEDASYEDDASQSVEDPSSFEQARQVQKEENDRILLKQDRQRLMERERYKQLLATKERAQCRAQQLWKSWQTHQEKELYRLAAFNVTDASINRGNRGFGTSQIKSTSSPLLLNQEEQEEQESNVNNNEAPKKKRGKLHKLYQQVMREAHNSRHEMLKYCKYSGYLWWEEAQKHQLLLLEERLSTSHEQRKTVFNPPVTLENSMISTTTSDWLEERNSIVNELLSAGGQSLEAPSNLAKMPIAQVEFHLQKQGKYISLLKRRLFSAQEREAIQHLCRKKNHHEEISTYRRKREAQRKKSSSSSQGEAAANNSNEYFSQDNSEKIGNNRGDADVLLLLHNEDRKEDNADAPNKRRIAFEQEQKKGHERYVEAILTKINTRLQSNITIPTQSNTNITSSNDMDHQSISIKPPSNNNVKQQVLVCGCLQKPCALNCPLKSDQKGQLNLLSSLMSSINFHS